MSIRVSCSWSLLSICFLLLLNFSCKVEKIQFEILNTPCTEGGEPNLFLSSKGDLLMSWIEYHEDSVSLMFSMLNNEEWTHTRTISSGDDWFVNWADFPSLVAHENNPDRLAAHWLQKSGDGTFDYDVMISLSRNMGESWSEPFVLHKDNIRAEHGFVSMVPMNEEKIFVSWLDGRNTKSENKSEDDHGHGGDMSLRGAVLDINGHVYNDEEIDHIVCDCCQTSSALTDKGPIVVYRDKSILEMRDIYIARREGGKWTEPHAVYYDNWHITGCPVNGPAVVAFENRVVVAWFSMADALPEVKLAISDDSGDNFALPLRIDKGNPIGRVDLELLTKDKVAVSWIEQSSEGADIELAIVDLRSKKVEYHNLISTENSRQSGFPKLALRGNDLYVVWTEVKQVTAVKSGVLKNVLP